MSTSWPSTLPASAALARPAPMLCATSATVTGPGNSRRDPSGSVIAIISTLQVPPAAPCAGLSGSNCILWRRPACLRAGDLFLAAPPAAREGGSLSGLLASDGRKKNAAKAAFLFVKPDPTGSKAHLDYCRLPAVVVRGVITMMRFRSVWVESDLLYFFLLQFVGRLDWTRTNDPHHVKVVL
ncbi:exported hypothetical protein [Cupriavidus neocaledonicus]|uniref:Transposase n=1 Tax=Cupriavidus neocaledonicus TaxID=1040979 RepID=A0ABY1V5R1_9BURK|nr:exported hypothetical protein [Cupriavidus neocaledonicus]